MKRVSAILAVACLLAATSTTNAWSLRSLFRRGLDEIEKTTLPDYQQCGGVGGACNSTGNKCWNKPWPGVKCAAESSCKKQSEFYYMCMPKPQVQAKQEEIPTEPFKKDGYTILPPWAQCGGKDGACKNFTDSCDDCPFPKTKCFDGHVCYKVVEYFWQCGPKSQYADRAFTCELESDAAPAPAPAAAVEKESTSDRRCEEPMEGMAVQGKRYKAIQMSPSDSNYDDCCSSCSSDSACVAFHLNKKSTTETVCALFNRFDDVAEHSSAVAGLMAGTSTIAG